MGSNLDLSLSSWDSLCWLPYKLSKPADAQFTPTSCVSQNISKDFFEIHPDIGGHEASWLSVFGHPDIGGHEAS